MISVVVAVYNIAEFVGHCIESILSQSFDDWELILVNDGSTDSSLSICEEYSRKESRIIVVNKPNGGLSSARNVGIYAARGDYLLFVDGDDYLRPGSLELLADLIERHAGLDFIQFRYDEVSDYSDRKAVGPVAELWETADRRRMFEQQLDLRGIGASACTKLISKDVFRDLRFKEGIIHEDELFTIHLNNRASKALYISNALYMYVRHRDSITTSKFSPKRLDLIDVMTEQIEVMEANGYSDLACRVRNQLFSNLCLMYARARQAKMPDYANMIMYYSRSMLPDVTITKGSAGLIARGMKLHLPMLPLYYLFRILKDGKDSSY